MSAFLYRCPRTDLMVQGFIADDPSKTDDYDAYNSIHCTACGRLHLVNPKTRKVFSADEE